MTIEKQGKIRYDKVYGFYVHNKQFCFLITTLI